MADDIHCNESASKKIKLDIENGILNQQENENTILNLTYFEPSKILFNNSDRKLICVLGKIENKEGDAILLLEKEAFSNVQLLEKNKGFLNSDLKLVFKNDVYFNYQCFSDIVLNSIKTTVIYPATEKHISKYAKQNIYIINETYELYESVILPYILKGHMSLQWVYNILEHKSEADRIKFEDPNPETGFILLPDLKWDGKTKETLYLLALVRNKKLKSLRDLNSSHLPLLNNIYEKGTKAIEDIYNIPKSCLRIYFHYQPSFYHLHVHFTYLRYDAPGIYAERAHLLTTVINNIELISNYYQRAALPFTIRENDPLFNELEQIGAVKKLLDQETSAKIDSNNQEAT